MATRLLLRPLSLGCWVVLSQSHALWAKKVRLLAELAGKHQLCIGAPPDAAPTRCARHLVVSPNRLCAVLTYLPCFVLFPLPPPCHHAVAAGYPITCGNSASETLLNAGDYTVTVTATATSSTLGICTGSDTQYVAVHVDPKPTVTVNDGNTPPSVCSTGDTDTYTTLTYTVDVSVASGSPPNAHRHCHWQRWSDLRGTR